VFKGHPKGLFRLFFIEMWERLGFYTMLAVLLLYAIDRETGGLGMSKADGNEIYGIYLAFVYFTPYIGGLLADRFLGYRRAVLIGGVLFASGFFTLSLGFNWSFKLGLLLLICANGFFKPNISAMVGNLYEPGDPKRDAGFNIFYMGINVGAFIAPFLAAYMRNEVSWEAAFLSAGVGMLIGITILLASWKVLERADVQPGTKPEDTPFSEIMLKILMPAGVLGVAAYFISFSLPSAITDLVKPSDIGFLVGSIPIIMFFINMARNATPEEKPGLGALLAIYVAGGTFFMVLHLNGSAMTAWAKENTDRRAQWVAELPGWLSKFAEDAKPGYYSNAKKDDPRPNKLNLLPIADEKEKTMFGLKRLDESALAALASKLPSGVAVEVIPAEDASDDQKRWSSLATTIYRDGKVEVKEISDGHGGKELAVNVDDTAEKLRKVAFVRTLGDGRRIATFVTTKVLFDNLYEGDPPTLEPGQYMPTASAELYQSFNPMFVVLFTPLIVFIFAALARAGREFSTAKKIFSGMIITALALLVMSCAGFLSNNGEAKVSWMWLGGFYAMVTVAELCLSPMALSLVTKLSPKRFVGLTMGGWFFATAVGNKFAGFLGGLQSTMADSPAQFFLVIAGGVSLVGLGVFLLLPRLDAAIKKYGA
jgi:dipeptide/tripeptide permease